VSIIFYLLCPLIDICVFFAIRVSLLMSGTNINVACTIVM
jgi:hypothetical protein